MYGRDSACPSIIARHCEVIKTTICRTWQKLVTKSKSQTSEGSIWSTTAMHKRAVILFQIVSCTLFLVHFTQRVSSWHAGDAHLFVVNQYSFPKHTSTASRTVTTKYVKCYGVCHSDCGMCIIPPNIEIFSLKNCTIVFCRSGTVIWAQFYARNTSFNISCSF